LPLKKNTSGKMSHKLPRFATEKEQQWQNESEDTPFADVNQNFHRMIATMVPSLETGSFFYYR
jgi:hypothetical protein